MENEERKKVEDGGAGGTYPIVEVDDSVNYAAGGGVVCSDTTGGAGFPPRGHGGRVNFSRGSFLPPRQPASFPRKSSWLAGHQAQLTFHRPHDCK